MTTILYHPPGSFSKGNKFRSVSLPSTELMGIDPFSKEDQPTPEFLSLLVCEFLRLAIRISIFLLRWTLWIKVRKFKGQNQLQVHILKFLNCNPEGSEKLPPPLPISFLPSVSIVSLLECWLGNLLAHQFCHAQHFGHDAGVNTFHFNLSALLTTHVFLAPNGLKCQAQALKSAQLQLEVEKNCNHQLEEKNTILEANKLRWSKKDNIPDKLVVYDNEIKVLAKKYGLMTKMFFPEMSAISQPMSNPPPPFQTPDYYTSATAEEECLVMELDSMLPDHIHHSDILHKLCDNTEEIFNLSKTYFKVPEVCVMLEIKDLSKPTYSLWIPFLFTDMKVNMAKLFTNWKALAFILKTSLLGKLSVVKDFSVFLLSPDASFPANGMGTVSKIPHCSTFWEYKWLLVTKWTDHHIKAIVTSMNYLIFGQPKTLAQTNGAMAGEDLTAEVDAAMAAIDAMTLLDDTTDDGPHSEPHSTPPLSPLSDVLADEIVVNVASANHIEEARELEVKVEHRQGHVD
ncbi:hypothetical protein J3A83DRAFT_4443670 [Scleroderma citrinum]